MPRKFLLNQETKALGASQIILGFIHSALGILWLSLFILEDEDHSTGPVSMLMLVMYSFISGIFFLTSGSCSVMQSNPTTCKLGFAMVMNIISLFLAIAGLIIVCIQLSVFEPKGIEYIWSHMAGMMLLQFLFLTSTAELILSVIVINALRRAFDHEVIQ